MGSARLESPPYVQDFSPPSSPESPNSADATLSEAWVTIRKRKYIILAATLLGLIYGFYQGITQPRIYQSSGTH